jgi:hypothetical protein
MIKSKRVYEAASKDNGLAGHGVERENLRPLGQRPANDVGLGAGACAHREDGLGHLDRQRRGLGVGVELKGMLVNPEQAVLGQGDVVGQRGPQDVEGVGEAHGATRWARITWPLA